MTAPHLAYSPDVDEELDSRNPLVMTLDGVLTPGECASLMARIDAAGPTPAPVTTATGFAMRPDLRNNSRVIFDDEVLAADLFERVRAALPQRLEQRWLLQGANERLRCYLYKPGEYFAPHFDGAFTRSRDERSLLTFMVYLNECELGGHTRFLDLELSVRPKAGTALLFNHHLLHEGAPVEAGVKYVVRSDVMYRRAEAADRRG